MPAQHQTFLLTLLPNMLSCVLAGAFFALSVWAPLTFWRPLTCALNEHGSCEFDATVSLLGVAVAAFAHSTAVAIFAWTPLSAPLRRTNKETQSSSMFNAFLYASMACDIIAYGHALTFMKGFVGFLQAMTITFNAPFIVFVPYILAAYSDPSTDLGSFVHRLKKRIVEYAMDEEDCSCGQTNCIHMRLERSLLIFPQSRGSYDDREEQSDEEGYMSEHERGSPVTPEMRPIETPRFQLFVTAPNEGALEQYMPLPVSQRV